MNSGQKKDILYRLMLFCFLSMFLLSMTGVYLFINTVNETLQTTIVNSMIINGVITLATGVCTFTLAITDASKDDLQQRCEELSHSS